MVRLFELNGKKIIVISTLDPVTKNIVILNEIETVKGICGE